MIIIFYYYLAYLIWSQIRAFGRGLFSFRASTGLDLLRPLGPTLSVDMKRRDGSWIVEIKFKEAGTGAGTYRECGTCRKAVLRQMLLITDLIQEQVHSQYGMYQN